jgi:membrane protease YdiL (CAAX protease family)
MIVFVISSLPNLLEALAFPAFVSLYIWRWQEASPKTWLIFPVWLLLSFALHRDTPKTIGWQADNLKPATRRAAPIFLFFFLILGLVGVTLGALHRTPAHFIAPQRFVGYFAFCLLQQIGLQSLTMNRLLKGLQSPEVAALVGGVLFGALHWPNPVLGPLTFIGGTVMGWLFARDRNIRRSRLLHLHSEVTILRVIFLFLESQRLYAAVLQLPLQRPPSAVGAFEVRQPAAALPASAR